MTTTKMIPTRDEAWRAPAVDIHENQGGMVLVADLPGVDETGIDLQIEKHVLRIEGRRRPHAEGERFHVDEIGPGSFRRSFRLSDDLDASGIEATIRDGVLRVEIPKSERLRPRTIPIRTE